MSGDQKKTDAAPPTSDKKPGVTREQLIALGHKVIEPPKFTEDSLRAAGFEVPPLDKGFGVVIVPVGRPPKKDPESRRR